jgi:hypothetical protein
VAGSFVLFSYHCEDFAIGNGTIRVSEFAHFELILSSFNAQL